MLTEAAAPPPRQTTVADSTASNTPPCHHSGELFDAYGIVNVSSFDLLVLSLFFFEPAREDMRRRGWWSAEPSPAEVARLAAFCVVPVLGPAAYVLARPALEE